MASRRMRRPLSRSCSQIGVFHSAGPPLSSSPPQMSLTSTSMWPWSSRIRSASVCTWPGSRWSTATAMPVPPRLRDELGRLLDRLGAVVLGPRPRAWCGRCRRPSRRPRPARRRCRARRRGSRRRRRPRDRAARRDPATRPWLRVCQSCAKATNAGGGAAEGGSAHEARQPERQPREQRPAGPGGRRRPT